MARVLAIGDIHGCRTALETLLGFVEPSAADQLVFLGDYVDRGPDSKGVLDLLIELKKNGNAVCLRGNHELMMAAARNGWDDFRFWTACGGMEALDSYATADDFPPLDSIPDAHWTFLERLRDYHETDTHIFVHANLKPSLLPSDQPSDWLHWQPISANGHQPHLSGKIMVCGHTQQREGVPLVLDRAVCIDTWAYGDGWLTCLDVMTGDYWQANELGQTRAGNL